LDMLFQALKSTMSSMMTSFYQNRRFAEVSNSFQGSIDIQCGLKIFFIKIDS
jgi:hypothetical protein